MHNEWLVGIPTYRRPQQLAAALESLERQIGAPSFTVCIADNDAEGSAKDCIDKYRATLEIEYINEPAPGVAHVRNAILQRAHDFEYLAFLDDDEVAEDNWLLEMSKAAKSFPGAVITGPVIYEIENGSEHSRLHAISFETKNYTSGKVLATTGTGNTLIPMFKLRSNAPGVLFDKRYSVTGGEDTKFFRYLSSMGIQIRWWPEAAVRETVPANRATRRATANRIYRAGYVNSMLRLERQSWILALLGAVMRVVAGLSVMIFGIGRRRRLKGYARFITGKGAVAAVLGKELRYYGKGGMING